MAFEPLCVRWIRDIAVVSFGPDAVGNAVSDRVSLMQLCHENKGVILEISECHVPSSELLGIIIRAHCAATTSYSVLRICCPHGLTREALLASEYNQIMPIYDTVEEAYEQFDSPSP